MQRLPLGLRLLLGEGNDALVEIADDRGGGHMALFALVTRRIGEVAFEQLGVRNDLRRRAVLVIVDREFRRRRAALLPAIVGLGIELTGVQFLKKIEVMRIDLGPLVLRVAVQEVRDGFGGDASVADGGGEQVGRTASPPAKCFCVPFTL